MQIKKILNNNVVISENQDGQEVIMMGKGIAFQRKVGDEITLKDIEKTFIHQSEFDRENLEQFVEKTPEIILDLAKEIMLLAEKEIGHSYSEKAYLSLTDHLFHVIQRAQAHIVLPNPLLFDIQKFYQKEFDVAVKSLDLIEQKMQIRLSEEEAGNIALHLATSATHYHDMTAVMQSTLLVKEILLIIQRYFGCELNQKSIHYQRMVTHIQFFIQRLLNDEHCDETDEFLYMLVQSKYPKAFQCSLRIQDYLKKKKNIVIEVSEIIYLTIHINRVIYGV